jgi:hypothetical protein
MSTSSRSHGAEIVQRLVCRSGLRARPHLAFRLVSPFEKHLDVLAGEVGHAVDR